MYIKLFLLGLSLGAGPCLIVCAPILLPYIAATKKDWIEGLKSTVVFSLFRTLAYIVLGFISAVSYSFIERFISHESKYYISLFAGAFVAIIGIILIVTKREIHLPVFKLLGKELLEKSTRSMPLLGLLVGFSPCLPMIGALMLIATDSTSALNGAFLGLSFGMGTFLSPLLLLGMAVGYIPQKVFKTASIQNTFRMICGILLVGYGLNLIKG